MIDDLRKVRRSSAAGITFVAVILLLALSKIVRWNLGMRADDLMYFAFTSLFFFFFLGAYLRSKNGYYLGLFIFLLLGTVYFGFLVFFPEKVARGLFPAIFQVVIAAYFVFQLIYAVRVPRVNFNYWQRYFRDWLKQAALPVHETENGFTDRPYPCGRTLVGQQTIRTFARFLSRNLFATAYIEPQRVLIVLSNGAFQYIPFLKPNLHKVTYIEIDDEGRISVCISKKHYSLFRDEFSFHQICSSLGRLIGHLLDLLVQGDGARIRALFRQELRI